MITNFLILCLAMLIIFVISTARKDTGILTYPFLAGLVIAAYSIPQLIAVSLDPLIPINGLVIMTIMTPLSIALAIWGWKLGIKHSAKRFRRGAIKNIDSHKIANERFLISVLVLTLVAIIARVLITFMTMTQEVGVQPTGPIVIIRTIAGTGTVALFLSALLYFKRMSPLYFSIFLINILVAASYSFIDLGRSEFVEFGVVIALALWFARSYIVPKAFVAVTIIGFTIVVYAMSDLRTQSRQYEDWTGESVTIIDNNLWESIDVKKAVSFAVNSAHDVRNGIYVSDYVNEQHAYTYGTGGWDYFIWRWVPGQIVGADIKQSLMFNADRYAIYQALEFDYGYYRNTGTTVTGFGMAFREFWFFGAVIFLVTGWVLGRWWFQACMGDIWSQIMYSSVISSSLISFTHHAYWFWLELPTTIACVIFIKLCASLFPDKSSSRHPIRI